MPTSNKALQQDQQLSLRARGLLMHLLSLPKNWKIYINEVTRHFPEGKHTFYKVFKELKQFGYIAYSQQRNAKGKFIQGNYQLIKKYTPIRNHRPSQQPPSSSVQQTFQQQKVVLQIGRELTSNQRELIKSVVDDLARQSKISAPKQMCQEIEAAIIDPKKFSLAGTDFLRKLYTIRKCIREGKWSLSPSFKAIPKVMAAPKNENVEKILRDQIFKLQSKIQSLQQCTQYPHTLDAHVSFKNEINKHAAQIKILQEKLAAL